MQFFSLTVVCVHDAKCFYVGQYLLYGRIAISFFPPEERDQTKARTNIEKKKKG